MRKFLAFSSEVSSLALALDCASLTSTPASINPLVLVLIGRVGLSLHTLAGIGHRADKWLSYSWSNQYIRGGSRTAEDRLTNAWWCAEERDADIMRVNRASRQRYFATDRRLFLLHVYTPDSIQTTILQRDTAAFNVTLHTYVRGGSKINKFCPDRRMFVIGVDCKSCRKRVLPYHARIFNLSALVEIAPDTLWVISDTNRLSFRLHCIWQSNSRHAKENAHIKKQNKTRIDSDWQNWQNWTQKSDNRA